MDLVVAYLPAWLGALRRRHQFRDVRAFCLFLGYPKSGHSLVGALLDAHPDAVVSHELHALKYIAGGFRGPQIFHLILERSRKFASGGRERGGYVYDVPGQWQGRHRRLLVLGDKKGEGTTRWLPSQLDRLRRRIDVPLRFIHVVRNPFDNISRIALRREKPLDVAAEHYFGLCATVDALRSELNAEEVLDLRHEEFVGDPASHLARLCDFLGLSVTPHYIEACAAIVSPSPHRSRFDASWSPELIAEVEERMGRFPFLEGYAW